jgi:hypothetical protein
VGDEKQVLRPYADERQKHEEMELAANRRPEITEGPPPLPMAAIDAVEFDMGTMLVDRTAGHNVRIKNGQTPLVLVWYPDRYAAFLSLPPIFGTGIRCHGSRGSEPIRPPCKAIRRKATD